jgi:sugar phosphate isomerase/epimerase
MIYGKNVFTRRKLLAAAGATAPSAMLAQAGSLAHARPLTTATAQTSATTQTPAAAAEPRPIVCAFSKHFQWTDVAGAAQVAADLGYEGMDLTVRPDGHVLPERVEDDLPKAAEAIRKVGLSLPMITTAITDTASPHAEPTIRTMSALGIRRYRWVNFRYSSTRSLPDQIADIKIKAKELAALNKQYGVCAMYHTHSGVNRFGASIWDLYLVLRDLDTESVGANYDIGHATIEGGLGGWVHSTRLLLPYMKGIGVKDFAWTRDAKGAWVPRGRPLGLGMVNFKQFFAMVKAARFAGPMEVHMEYPELGGADQGGRELTIPRERLISMFRRDLDVLKGMLREAGWA